MALIDSQPVIFVLKSKRKASFEKKGRTKVNDKSNLSAGGTLSFYFILVIKNILSALGFP